MCLYFDAPLSASTLISMFVIHNMQKNHHKQQQQQQLDDFRVSTLHFWVHICLCVCVLLLLMLLLHQKTSWFIWQWVNCFAIYIFTHKNTFYWWYTILNLKAPTVSAAAAAIAAAYELICKFIDLVLFSILIGFI